jgi:hypothetical protein
MGKALGLERICGLFIALVSDIHDRGIFSIWDASIGEVDYIGINSWKPTTLLYLDGDKVVEWEYYTGLLYSNLISLQEEENYYHIWAQNEKFGQHTLKWEYLVLAQHNGEGDMKWWWKYIWSMHAPLKVNILSWLAMENRLLTWENGLKRGWISPGRCGLYMNTKESTLHIFVLCSFTQ